MDIKGRNILMLGGSGLVGIAIARKLLPLKPARLVIAALRQDESEEGVATLRREPDAEGVELVAEWGDILLRASRRDESRTAMLETDEGRAEILDDLLGHLKEEDFSRNLLYMLLEQHEPSIVIDCVNTATAIAYQDLFTSAGRLRDLMWSGGKPTVADIEAHLTTLYLPQLIRHVQVLMHGMRRARTEVYLKIGTSGTGGMGLNVPFTHSEERPSATLLSKSSVSGAHSALLFLMGRTPDSPVVKEVKPTAAVAWKRITYGPVRKAGKPIRRFDCRNPVDLSEAFTASPEGRCIDTGEALESVYLDAGENGLFSLGEYETISALGLMEIITPEEIADAAIAEIRGRPTGRDIVGALDAATMGPTYRGGALRETALRYMEELESEHDVRSVAFEMLGPPRLSKLLFEAEILRRLFPDVRRGAELDPAATAARSLELIESDDRLRSDVLSIGIPVLLPDGKRMLRGPRVSVEPDGPPDPVWANRGWVDLRPESWSRWRDRLVSYIEEVLDVPGAEFGSGTDLDVRARSGDIRPGALAAYVFRFEDEGERMKR
ncbi:MAG: short-chain dehydrogenase [marine benthic group bacterium]|nr:short-chain dehydrogenase [Candidatus Benthicola marisminoris]